MTTPWKAYATAATVGLLTWGAGAAPAHAQTTVPPPSQATPSLPQHDLPGPTTPRPGTRDKSRPNDSLGQAPGVIRPPASSDKGVIAPPNQSNTPTPVIRPPGTRGGNPDVQPK